LAHLEPEELASWEGSYLMCRRQNVLLTLQGEATGDRDPPPQGTLCSPFSRSGKYEIVLQEEDSRGTLTSPVSWTHGGIRLVRLRLYHLLVLRRLC